MRTCLFPILIALAAAPGGQAEDSAATGKSCTS